MQDNNYRNADTPMALHAIAQPLVDSMHAEIRMLYSLLCDTCKLIAYDSGQEWDSIDAKDLTEKAIARHIESDLKEKRT